MARLSRRGERTVVEERASAARATDSVARVRVPIWMAIAVVIATFAAYAPALRAPFVFDDVTSIQENTTIRQLYPPSVPLKPPVMSAVAGRPVVNYSLALNYALNEWLGVDQRADPDGPYKTVGYHLMNLLLHLGCGALIFGVMRRTMRGARIPEAWRVVADPIAAVVTGLWLLDPIQSEAINYVVQRTELIVSLCYVGTLYAAVRAGDAESTKARKGWYVVAMLVCLLGMGSKEVMITAPLMVVLYDRAFRVDSWRALFSADRGRLWLYGGLVATCIWTVILVTSGARATSVGFHLGVTWYQYLYSQGWAITHYVRLALWPDALTLDYGQNAITGLRALPGLLLLVVFGAVTVWAWMRANRWGWLGFLGAWFFLILAPSSSIVPIRTEIAAERRVYLALAAVLVLLVIGAEWLRRRWAERRDPRWGLGAVGTLLALSTFARSRMYESPEGLWRDTIRKAPSNARAYDNLSAILRQGHPPRWYWRRTRCYVWRWRWIPPISMDGTVWR